MTRCGDIRNSTYHEGCICDPILREGEVVEGHRSYRGKSDDCFLYAPHSDFCAISDRSAAAALNSTTLGQNFRVFPWNR